MRVIITWGLLPQAEEHFPQDYHWCPDLAGADDATWTTALEQHRPHVLITRQPPGATVLAAWRNIMAPEATVLVMPTLRPTGAPREEVPSVRPPWEDTGTLNGTPVLRVGIGSGALDRALASAERFLNEAAVAAERAGWFPGPAARDNRSHPIRQSVLVVGAGVVNLLVAERLQREGFKITLVDQYQDPRADRPWLEYGCSRGGGNARMFSLTEADDYHDKGTPASAGANLVFDRPPAALGWDVRMPGTDDGNTRDQEWVREFKRVPPWLARAFNRDIFGLTRRSGELWDEFMVRHPEYFGDVCLRHDVLRLYDDPGDLSAAIERHERVGATLSLYQPEEVRERYQALADAEPGFFTGAILVRGFTVNVHDLMTRLLDSLEKRGAEVRFGVRIERLVKDDAGRMASIVTSEGPLVFRHCVISPGAYGGSLLDNTRAAGMIHGVLGCWVTLPNLAPRLENSLKVTRRGHVTQDANVTVGRDAAGQPLLTIGSGYGWTGADPGNISPDRLAELYAGVNDSARRLFPRAYGDGGGEPGLRRTYRFCVRPWTASNLGVFDVLPGTNGVVVVAGGHNTGGFAQGPVIAEAVLHTLRGQRHPMQVLYHPRRVNHALGMLHPPPGHRSRPGDGARVRGPGEVGRPTEHARSGTFRGPPHAAP